MFSVILRHFSNIYDKTPSLIKYSFGFVATLYLLKRLLTLPRGPSKMGWSGLVVGHRGARFNGATHPTSKKQYPENTIESFIYAIESGADGIEFDIRLIKSGEYVVFHDGFINPLVRFTAPRNNNYERGNNINDMSRIQMSASVLDFDLETADGLMKRSFTLQQNRFPLGGEVVNEETTTTTTETKEAKQDNAEGGGCEATLQKLKDLHTLQQLVCGDDDRGSCTTISRTQQESAELIQDIVGGGNCGGDDQEINNNNNNNKTNSTRVSRNSFHLSGGGSREVTPSSGRRKLNINNTNVSSNFPTSPAITTQQQAPITNHQLPQFNNNSSANSPSSLLANNNNNLVAANRGDTQEGSTQISPATLNYCSETLQLNIQAQKIPFDDLSLHDIKQLRYIGSDRSITMPTFEEVIQVCEARKVSKVFVEIKTYSINFFRLMEMTREYIEFYKRHKEYMDAHTVTIAFNPLILYLIRYFEPNIAVGLLHEAEMFWENGTDLYEPEAYQNLKYFPEFLLRGFDHLLWFFNREFFLDMIGCSMYGPKFDYVEEKFLQRLYNKDICTYLWGLKDPAQIRPELKARSGVCISCDEDYNIFRDEFLSTKFGELNMRARQNNNAARGGSPSASTAI